MKNDDQCRLPPLALLRLQSWFSPVLPAGFYSYSHALEWAVEAHDVYDRASLVDWLQSDLCHGSGRNEAIFFKEAWCCATKNGSKRLLDISELAAAFRGTEEFALESSQPAAACLTLFKKVWPDRSLELLAEMLRERNIPPALGVVLGVRCAGEAIPLSLALPVFLHSYAANLVSAGIRLIPLGQTDGQFAIAELERCVEAVSAAASASTIDDLGSAAFMVDLASMSHETQHTRLFRS
jgi:urease accessory protein